MKIKAKSKITAAPSSQYLPVFSSQFESDRIVFVVTTSTHSAPGLSTNVSLQAGPLGAWFSADEAEAIGEQLIAAARHYRNVMQKVEAT